MEENRSGCGRTLAYGGLGCLGIIVLIITISAVVAGVAWHQSQEINVTERELTRKLTLPKGMAEPEGSASPAKGASFPAAGKVVLDISQTELYVKPGPPGEPIRVSGKFDANSYELNERYIEGDAEHGWTYKVDFDRTASSSLMAGLARLMSGAKPRIVVLLPPDVPFDLDLTVSQGGGEVELGGLWLTNADIEFRQGGGEISVSDPLRYPADTFRIEFSMGGGDIRRLGNASPRKLDVKIGMGGGDIDLRGAWSRDAQITIDQSMGGASVRLPRDVEIRGLEHTHLQPPADHDVPRPVLTFEVSSRIGGLDIVE